LLEEVLVQLRAEYAGDGKAPLFDALQNYLSGDRGLTPYAELAPRMNMSEAALRMAVLRLRRRFGELLRQEIAHTVATEEEIGEEIRALFAALRR
jgi:RNA polymerase sigma-70 factor (ECF subfamily)